jgi:16S rRNA (adenine1518-N6/adenine1519-N6)-dimethyltransferase
MPAPASHQTISYLGRRFAEAGIRLNHRHGQNFLIDLNLLQMIADSAQLDRQDVALEVGTGTGALTGILAQRAGAVVTVEIDPQLHQLAREELLPYDNVTMLQTDALKSKSQFADEVLDAVARAVAATNGGRLKLVANLPYSVATPIMANLLLSPIVPHLMSVTIQKELADRIVATPGTKDYGALAIWMQSQCHVQLVRTLPPSVFWPRPKVTSAIVKLEVDPALRARIPDLQFFHDFVRSLFLHRRKLLRGVLVSALKGELEKPEVDQVLADAGIAGDLRAEQLEVPAMIALCEGVRRRIAV